MKNENPSAPEDSSEPKIIVDEDWKSQVEKEKEALKAKDTDPTSSSETGSTKKESHAQSESALPPVSFAVLLSTLATQAMAGLGILPDPLTGKPAVNRPLAKHFVDTMAMLEEKTKGNLTDSEATQLRDSLHQLRMIYLSTPAGPPPVDNSPAAPSSSTLELP